MENDANLAGAAQRRGGAKLHGAAALGSALGMSKLPAGEISTGTRKVEMRGMQVSQPGLS